jgi:putative restriction endonuclease
MTEIQDLFTEAVSEIEGAYARLGHRLGWRFLLTPMETFTPEVPTLLLSFHPGGSVEPPDQPRASSEAGSGYDVERWDGAPAGMHPLQVQVREMLAAFGETTAGTLSAYFVPFRAPTSEQMASPEASLAFAGGLWRTLLPVLQPQVIIALGRDAYAGVAEALGRTSKEETLPAGWGAQTITLAQFGAQLVVRLPHLSQFKLMSREEGREAVRDVARRVAAFRAGLNWWADAASAGLPQQLAAGVRTRLEKAAVDNGFDLVREPVAAWIPVRSSHAPLDVWLTVDGDRQPIAALSRGDVAAALADVGSPATITLPAGAAAAREVSDVGTLHRRLRRAYQLARTLPNELLHTFTEQTADLPRATEAERLVVQRVGQDVFRAGLLEYWDGRCAVTGLAVPELLRASHIKPWAACDTDAERLDVFNGLLLAPNLDAAFDAGLITVADDGAVVVSPALTAEDRGLLGLEPPLRVQRVGAGHRRYLSFHRKRVFR